jgi:hypothetical protein
MCPLLGKRITGIAAKAINARLPELTGEIDLVSITTRDINAGIGAIISPK